MHNEFSSDTHETTVRRLIATASIYTTEEHLEERGTVFGVCACAAVDRCFILIVLSQLCIDLKMGSTTAYCGALREQVRRGFDLFIVCI